MCGKRRQGAGGRSGCRPALQPLPLTQPPLLADPLLPTHAPPLLPPTLASLYTRIASPLVRRCCKPAIQRSQRPPPPPEKKKDNTHRKTLLVHPSKHEAPLLEPSCQTTPARDSPNMAATLSHTSRNTSSRLPRRLPRTTTPSSSDCMASGRVSVTQKVVAPNTLSFIFLRGSTGVNQSWGDRWKGRDTSLTRPEGGFGEACKGVLGPSEQDRHREGCPQTAAQSPWPSRDRGGPSVLT